MSNKYRLTRPIPGFPAGTIFEHRSYDEARDIGSIGWGYLTNIWIDGDCQKGADGVVGWGAETHIFPGSLVDTDWFKPIGKKKRKCCCCTCGGS